ncbi:glycosyltransferase family 4 protein [Geodermatophilus normandii]|nr:glycosyltransferase family 4 protein [Geodermatophilus normandii]
MEEVVAFLARRLPAEGVEVAVLHASPSGSQAGRLARALSAEGILVLDASCAEVREGVRRWQPDVVSGHGAAPWVLDLANDLDVPYVDTLHGMHDLFRTDWAAERQRGHRIAAVVTVSELIKSQYLRGNPVMDSASVVTIPNAVDDRQHRPVDRELARATLGLDREFLWVSLGRFSMQKNAYALVRVFLEVAKAHPEAHLLVAGRPDDRAYAEQVVSLRDRSAHRRQVHLRDHCPRPAVVLAAADAFVLDSFFEGWSLASMEALYAGLPVVMSDVGGGREQLGEDGRRGHLVANPAGRAEDVSWERMSDLRYARQHNEAELSCAMAQVMAERDRWAEARGQLRAESIARFDPQRCVQAHAELLRAVTERSSSRLGGAAAHTGMRRS